MPFLRIQTPDGRFLRIDVTGYDPTQYDDLATAAVTDYSVGQPRMPIPSDVQNEAGLETSPLMVMPSDVKQLGTETKAGISGLADIANPQQAAENVANVEAGKSPTTTEGKVGEFIGSMATPAQIALQGGLGAILEASGIGEAAANMLKGWGESAALNAVGFIKSIGKGIGVGNLEELAQFLLNPVTIGGKELPAVVSATSSPKEMLAAAEAIQKAAGAALGKVSPVVDEAINANPGAIDLKGILENLDKMRLAVQETAPNLGKAVVQQYEQAIDDFLQVVQKSTQEANPSLFTDLRDLKTTIGDLVYRHGSPLQSKAALEDAYAALSKGVDAAAKAASPTVGAAFDEANAVYNKIISVIEFLEGKVLSNAAKGFFNDVPALAAGMAAGVAHGPLGIVTGPAAFLTAKALQNYGPQAIAQGLNTVAAPLISPAINAAARAVPLVGNVIAQGLSQEQ